ncbi:MAG: lipase family protein [Gemmataceae bacterium]
MSLELNEDASGDPGNAGFMALASDFAYLPADQGLPKYKDELGLDAKLVSVDNTQAYVCTNANHIVVAFRGTEDPTSIDGLKDWLLTDAVNLLIVPEGRLGTDFAAAGVGAKFHQGFIGALAEIWDPLFAAVESEVKKQDRPLWITGHSLGGALALLSAWLFQRKFVNVHQVITFGAPMIGNTVAKEAFDKELKGKVFRYCNEIDPVPMLPTVSLLANDFAHCDRRMGLTETAGNAIEMFKALASKAAGGILSGHVVDEVWGEVKTRLSAHFIPSYHELVNKLGHK